MKRSVASVLVCLTMLFGIGACSEDGENDSRTSSSADTAASQAPQKPRPPRRPKVGDCHRLTSEEALAPVAPKKTRVKCSRKPTSVTFHVGRIKQEPDGSPLPVDSPKVQKQVARACPDRLEKHLGGNKDLLRRSLLTTVWFTPTIEQEEAGAHWFRCDLVAPVSDKTLLVLQTPVKGLLDDPDRRERYALCANGEPGKNSFARTSCRDPHAWRAVGTVEIPGETYPGTGSIKATMDKTCTDAATAEAANPFSVKWSQEGPTRAQWKAGRRHGTCWIPS